MWEHNVRWCIWLCWWPYCFPWWWWDMCQLLCRYDISHFTFGLHNNIATHGLDCSGGSEWHHHFVALLSSIHSCSDVLQHHQVSHVSLDRCAPPLPCAMLLICHPIPVHRANTQTHTHIQDITEPHSTDSSSTEPELWCADSVYNRHTKADFQKSLSLSSASQHSQLSGYVSDRDDCNKEGGCQPCDSNRWRGLDLKLNITLCWNTIRADICLSYRTWCI